MPLQEFLEQSARRRPDKTALVCGDRRLTYRELDAQANRLAGTFLDDGLRPGDRVAIFLDNTVESIVALFAALKSAGVFVQINPTTKPDKFVYLLNHCRAAALVTHTSKLDELSTHWTRMTHLRHVYTVGDAFERPDVPAPDFQTLEAITLREPNPSPPRPFAGDGDLAAVIYTSGSTGTPKGVMLTHGNLFFATRTITGYLENTEEDVLLGVLPLSFGYGLTQVLSACCAGAALVLERSFAFPHVVLESLGRERVTGFALVPTVSAMMLQMNFDHYDFSSLRYITNAAAAFPREHIRQFRERLPRVKLFPMHGLTECIRVTYLPPDQIDRRPESVGRGMPGQVIEIVNEQGRPVGPGETGELVVCGPHVMRGYWDDPEITNRVLSSDPVTGERTLRTGDLFKKDEEGYLYFVSRKDDIIKTRGEKVSPKEVEDVLYSVDGVAEAAVLGVPDPILGQAVVAAVYLKNSAAVTEQTLLFHCKQKLEDFMIPKRVVICKDPLPKTPSGKILKRELAAQI